MLASMDKVFPFGGVGDVEGIIFDECANHEEMIVAFPVFGEGHLILNRANRTKSCWIGDNQWMVRRDDGVNSVVSLAIMKFNDSVQVGIVAEGDLESIPKET